MDINKIFTALNGFVKSCWRLLLLLTSRSIRDRLLSGITNDRITCITGTDRFSNIKCFDKSANSVHVADITDIIRKDKFTDR